MGLIDDIISSIGLAPSDEETNLLRTGEQLSQADLEAIEQDTAIRARLEAMLGELGEGGRPPVFNLDLRNPTDINEFIQGIAPTGELEGLFRLLGAGRPNANSNPTAAGLGLQQGRRDNLERIAHALLMGFGGGTAGSNGNPLSGIGGTGTQSVTEGGSLSKGRV